MQEPAEALTALSQLVRSVRLLRCRPDARFSPDGSGPGYLPGDG